MRRVKLGMRFNIAEDCLATVVISIFYVASTCRAFTFVERKWSFLLPKETMDQLYTIESDPTLGQLKAERLIDETISALPRSTLDQLELPPYYRHLPADAKWRIKELLFDKNLSYRQKHEAIFDIIIGLTENEKRFVTSSPTRMRKWRNGGRTRYARLLALKRRIGKSAPLLPHFGVDYDSNYLEGGDDVETDVDDRRERSRLFDSFNALQYTVRFTFTLKELRQKLPTKQFTEIYTAFNDDQLNVERKLAAVEAQMSTLDVETLDHLFNVGMPPMTDAALRERFRRLWFDRPYWLGTMDQSRNEFGPADPLPDNFNLPVNKTLSANSESSGRKRVRHFTKEFRMSSSARPPLDGRGVEESQSPLEVTDKYRFGYGEFRRQDFGGRDGVEISASSSPPPPSVRPMPLDAEEGGVPSATTQRFCIDCTMMSSAGASAREAAANLPPYPVAGRVVTAIKASDLFTARRLSKDNNGEEDTNAHRHVRLKLTTTTNDVDNELQPTHVDPEEVPDFSDDQRKRSLEAAAESTDAAAAASVPAEVTEAALALLKSGRFVDGQVVVEGGDVVGERRNLNGKDALVDQENVEVGRAKLIRINQLLRTLRAKMNIND